MRHIKWFALLALIALVPRADAQFLGPGWWKTAAPASYAGPGDVVALKWWVGLRAYSAATAGAAALNICSESGGVDVTCEDELTSATTGKLVLGTIGATCSSVTCTVKIWYDRTGNNACASAPCNFTQTTVADRATFLITGCPGTSGQPCASFNGSSDCYTTGGAVGDSQPYSETAVSYKTSSASNESILIFDSSTAGQVGYSSTANTAGFYAGSFVSATASDNALHSFQAIFNDPSSSAIYVDGVSTSGSVGSGNATLPADIGSVACTSQFLGGFFSEVGFAVGAFSGGNVSALTSNQRAFWGF